MKRQILTLSQTIIPLYFLLCTLSTAAQEQMTFQHSCNFADADSLVELYTYAPSQEAHKIVERIMNVINLPPNFEIKAADCKNALATTLGKQRYILYSTTFLAQFKKDANTSWAAYFVMAHEIGHHLSNHDLEETDPKIRKKYELESDVFAGGVLFKLGANMTETQAGINSFAEDAANSRTHPPKRARLEAAANGWLQAKETEENKFSIEGERRLVSQEDKAKAKALYDETMQMGYWDRREHFDQIISLDPNFAPAYWQLSLYYNEYDDKEYYLLKALELDSTLAGPYYELAIFARGKPAKIQLLDKAIHYKKDFAEAYFVRSKYNHGNDYNNTAALNDINEAIKYQPDESSYYEERIDILQTLGRLEETLPDYDYLIRLFPEHNKKFYMAKGKVLLDLKHFETFESFCYAYFDKILDGKLNSRELPGYKGNLMQLAADQLPTAINQKMTQRFTDSAARQNSPDLAICYYGLALDLQPRSIPLLLSRGFKRQELEDREADEDFDAVLQIDPLHADAHYGKAYQHCHIHHSGRSYQLLQFDNLVNQFPDPGDYFLLRGIIQCGCYGYADAFADFEKALHLNKKTASLYAYKSLAHYQLGQYQQAIQSANEALKIDKTIHTSKADAEAAFSKEQKMTKSAQQAAAGEWLKGLEKDDVSSLTKVAWLQKAISLYPEFTEARLALGLLLGRQGEALEQYNKVISYVPDHAGAHAQRSKLLLEFDSTRAYVLQQLDAAIAKTTKAALLYLLKGDIYIGENYSIKWNEKEDADTYLAKECYEKAIHSDPSLAEAYGKLGCLLVTLKQHKEALEPLTKALQLNPKLDDAVDCRKQALQKMN